MRLVLRLFPVALTATVTAFSASGTEILRDATAHSHGNLLLKPCGQSHLNRWVVTNGLPQTAENSKSPSTGVGPVLNTLRVLHYCFVTS